MLNANDNDDYNLPNRKCGNVSTEMATVVVITHGLIKNAECRVPMKLSEGDHQYYDHKVMFLPGISRRFSSIISSSSFLFDIFPFSLN